MGTKSDTVPENGNAAPDSEAAFKSVKIQPVKVVSAEGIEPSTY